ncbi:hypothetical protein ACFL01_01100 [Planctomycetota bacterium]
MDIPVLGRGMVLALTVCVISSCVPDGTKDDSRPSVPLLRQPASPVKVPYVSLIGYADPRNRITVYVNSRRAATALSDDDGRFEVARLRLKLGENVVTAVATDWAGRRSRSTVTGTRIKQDVKSTTTPRVRVVYAP